MKIIELKVEGYRKLKYHDNDFGVQGSVLVLSGQNGSGKTSLLEAIHLLLGKPVSNINQDDAQAITADSCYLEIAIKLEPEEINSVVSLLKSNLNNSQQPQIDFESLKSRIFKDGIFRRSLNIDRYYEQWSQNRNRHIEELIHGEIMDWPFNVGSTIFALQIFCRFFGRIEDINVYEINLLNTQWEYAQTTSHQFEGNRKSKTTTQLSDLITIPVNRKIMEGQRTELIQEIKENTEYLSSGLIDAKVTFDEDHFLNTGRVLLGISYGDDHFPITQASSGQKQAIALLALMRGWAASTLKPILLFDEPDLGMHPSMIRAVTRKFKEEVDRTKASCLIATHSTDLIKSYAENVFRVIKESDGRAFLIKVANLSDRVKLLNDIGAEFDLDYLVPKLIFVESTEERAEKHGIPDELIYQQLVDKEKTRILFKSGIKDQGGATQLEQRREAWNSMIRAITENDSDALILRDRDDGSYRGVQAHNTNLNTPYRNVEYFFVADPNIVSEVINPFLSISMNSGEILEYFKSRDQKYSVGDILNADGKRIWQDFLDFVRVQRNFDEKNTQILERKIIDLHVKQGCTSFAPLVKDFLNDLSRI